MKFKINDLQMALNAICKQYKVGLDSSMDLALQEDNPGEGKISDILTINVVGSDGKTGLMVEVYGYSENRPPRSVYTRLLEPEKKES